MLSRPPIWTAAYSFLCSSVFLSYGQYALLVVTIPLYVVHLGGSPFLAGIVLLSFSLPSFSLRPFVGFLADSWSAAGVLALGALLIATGSALYVVPAFLAVFVASATRGLGWAGLNTGGYTVLTHLTPPSRRGEAAGYYTSITGAASLAFPAVALWLLAASHGGFNTVFLLAALFALASSTIACFALRPRVFIPRIQRGASTAGGTAAAAAAALIDRGVLLATALNAAVTLSQPAITAFLPLYARQLGIPNIGLFYIVAGGSDLLCRPVFGRAGDRVGRGWSIVPAFAAQILGILLIVISPTLPAILVCGLLNGAGSAINSSASLALGMDLADPARRGAAMATYSLSYQLGNGLGAVLAGSLVTLAGYRAMYLGSLAILGGGLALALANWKRVAHVLPVRV